MTCFPHNALGNQEADQPHSMGVICVQNRIVKIHDKNPRVCLGFLQCIPQLSRGTVEQADTNGRTGGLCNVPAAMVSHWYPTITLQNTNGQTEGTPYLWQTLLMSRLLLNTASQGLNCRDQSNLQSQQLQQELNCILQLKYFCSLMGRQDSTHEISMTNPCVTVRELAADLSNT